MSDDSGAQDAGGASARRCLPTRTPREIRRLNQLLRVEAETKAYNEAAAAAAAAEAAEAASAGNGSADASNSPPNSPLRTPSRRLPPLSSQPRSPLIMSRVPVPADSPAFLTHTRGAGHCPKCEVLKRWAQVAPFSPDAPESHAYRIVRGPCETAIVMPRQVPLSRSSSLPALSSEVYLCWRRRQEAAEREAERLLALPMRGRAEAEEAAKRTFSVMDSRPQTYGYTPRKEPTKAERDASTEKAREETKRRLAAKRAAEARRRQQQAEAELAAAKSESIKVPINLAGTEADWERFGEELPVGRDPKSKRRREALYEKWDRNANDCISFSEIDTSMKGAIGGAGTELKGKVLQSALTFWADAWKCEQRQSTHACPHPHPSLLPTTSTAFPTLPIFRVHHEHRHNSSSTLPSSRV